MQKAGKEDCDENYEEVFKHVLEIQPKCRPIVGLRKPQIIMEAAILMPDKYQNYQNKYSKYTVNR